MDSGQTMTSGFSSTTLGEHRLGNVENAVLVAGSGELHDHLASRHVLAGSAPTAVITPSNSALSSV